MKTLTQSEFKAMKFDLNTYTSNEVVKAEKLAKEVSALYPCHVEYIVSNQDGKDYFERAVVRLQNPILDLTIQFNEYRKKYFVFCDFRELRNITHYTVSEAKQKLIEPNQIGVLSEKKLLQWINYYEDLYKILSDLDSFNGGVKDEFLRSIEGLGVKWYNDGKEGEIISNGIKFSFKITETYVSQNIEVYYAVPTTIDSFLKLSDNAYTMVGNRLK